MISPSRQRRLFLIFSAFLLAGLAGCSYPGVLPDELSAIDPYAANWEIEQASFPNRCYHLSLKMKRLYSGGAGEARVVFQQRAKEIMQQNGFDAYTVVEYTEGLDSSVLGSQRVAQGVIQLTRK